jgi:hypothetical protein
LSAASKAHNGTDKTPRSVGGNRPPPGRNQPRARGPPACSNLNTIIRGLTGLARFTALWNGIHRPGIPQVSSFARHRASGVDACPFADRRSARASWWSSPTRLSRSRMAGCISRRSTGRFYISSRARRPNTRPASIVRSPGLGWCDTREGDLCEAQEAGAALFA